LPQLAVVGREAVAGRDAEQDALAVPGFSLGQVFGAGQAGVWRVGRVHREQAERDQIRLERIVKESHDLGWLLGADRSEHAGLEYLDLDRRGVVAGMTPSVTPVVVAGPGGGLGEQGEPGGVLAGGP